jgi:hypothetical protein
MGQWAQPATPAGYVDATSSAGTAQLGTQGIPWVSCFAWQASTLSYVHLLVDSSGNLLVTGGGGGGGGSVTQGTTPWVDNIAQWGGVATSLGQNVMASSVPVTLASNQSALPITFGTVDPGNSSTTILGNGGVFIGTAFDALNYNTVAVNITSDQAGTISLQMSPDGSNWNELDANTYNPTLDSGGTFSVISPLRVRYFRVVYVNGGVAQTYFRLQTLYKSTSMTGDVLEGNDQITGSNHAQITRTIQVITPLSPVSASVTASDSVVLAANPSRKGVVVMNLGTVNVNFGCGTTAILNGGITLTPNGTWVMDTFTYTTSALHAICSSSSTLAIQEYN